MAAPPQPPRLGHMLVAAADLGLARTAAEVAVMHGERGLGGADPDLDTRLSRWRTEKGKRAEAGRGLAKRWAHLAPLPRREGLGVGGRPRDLRKDRPTPDPSLPGRGEEVAVCVALAFPDRVARRRDTSGETWVSVGGRGFRLDPTVSLARHDWLAVAETQGMAAGARILSRSEEHTSELQSLMRISYAVFCLKKKQ